MPMLLFRRFALLSLLVITLAACGGPPAVPVSQLESPKPVSSHSPAVETQAPIASAAPTPESTATQEPTVTSAPTPTPDLSLVTGENTFARGAITKRPWMVMIDNHPDAYPQSGMNQAALVFEGLAEYGITRFIALYADGITPNLNEIGPVRSTRLYFAQWAMGFHPVYAHAGGSPDGVHASETTDLFVNFEALRLPKFTWRDQRRIAPHNLYTSSELLRAFADSKDVSEFNEPDVGYLFEQIPAASPVEVRSVSYFFLDRSSRAGFTYDPASNGYHRVMRGRAHVDRVTGQQLWTRNVVVMQVQEAARAGDAKRRIDQEVVGSGPAQMFMAGRRVDGTWRKESEAAPLRFYDGAGSEVRFNAGPIWIAAIPTFERLTVQ
jgi:hypothetical protein